MKWQCGRGGADGSGAQAMRGDPIVAAMPGRWRIAVAALPAKQFPAWRFAARRLAARGVAARGLVAAVLVAGALGAAPARACPPEARPEPPLVLRAGAVERLRAGLPLRILAIGSSSTAGVGASRPNLTFPAQLADRLGAALGEGRVEVTNAGVSGESSPATLKRLQAFLQAPETPDLVIWQVGTNDVIFGGTPERLATMVTDGLAAAQAADVAVMVVDQQYFRAILSVPRYEQFVAAVNSAAQARGITVLGRYRMMKAWAAADPKGFRALFAWDGFHMNDAGYGCLAQLAFEAVLEAVDGARAGQSPGPATAAPLPLPPPREIR